MDNHEPDTFEKRVRFGCGFLFGGVLAFLITLREVFAFDVGPWFVILAVALAFGLLAVRYGDRFWHYALRLFSSC